MEGWKEIFLGKLGDTFTGLSGKTKDDFGFGSKYIQYVNIFNNSRIDIGNLELVNVKSNEKQSKVKFGDIFFTTSSETIEEVGMSSVLLDEINEDIYLNSFCFGFRLFDFDNLLPEYAQHLLRAAHMRHSISMFGKGSTRYNLSKTLLLKDLVLVFPTLLTEQQKIATRLSTIELSIAQTEQLIAKYKKIKQGLMHDLLTYGIDQNSTIRKPQTHNFANKNGILVPEEWSITFIGKSSYLKGRIGWQGLKASEFLEEGPYLVTGTDIQNGSVCWDTCYHVSETRYKEADKIQLKNDDLIITKDGTIGKVAIVRNCPQQAVLNSGLFLLRCIDGSYTQLFLFYILRSSIFLIFLANNEGGSTIKHLYQNVFVKFPFPTPSIDEQNRVTNILEKHDTLIESEQTNLAKLQKLKQGLMQDLLTGKVRVKI